MEQVIDKAWNQISGKIQSYKCQPPDPSFFARSFVRDGMAYINPCFSMVPNEYVPPDEKITINGQYL